MLAAERRNRILTALEAEGRVLVADLSQLYGVSEETIRRDLEKLEEEGFARRCYGGASFTGSPDLPYSIRKKSHVSGKRQIAQIAAGLIPDGASVAFDESSTAAFVAQALKGRKGITLLTNSVELVLSLGETEDWQIYVTGGLYNEKNLSFGGLRVEEFLREHHTDFAVISCAGLDPELGLTDPKDEMARIKRAMIRSAGQTILAADSRKFDRRSFAVVGKLEDVGTLITDSEPDEAWKERLEKAGVRLLY